ncbi:MAG: ABC transporter permease [Gemmatimonadota bacterium]|nr:ABC transporter permease [Gemmatimonadota bacterium]
METLTQDLRYVARSFARSPGFLFTTVLTLALGIGATTAIFSVVNSVLLRPLPYPESDRIVQLFQSTKDGTRNSVTEPNFIDWKAQTRSFSAIGLSSSASVVTVNGLSEPTRAPAAAVSRDFFRVFGLRPEIGRTFVEEEVAAGAPTSVIVSHSFWRAHLSGSTAVAGKTIRIGTDLLTIVGVMPEAMDYPAGTDLWIPHEPNSRSSRTTGGWRAVARIKNGMTLEQARRDVSSLSRRLKQQYGDETGMFDAETVPLHELVVGKVRGTLMILLGASAFLLLIACANVVNLLVARMSIRRSEIGLRMALGASRARLARQLLTEAGVLSLAGGLIGMGLATLGVRALLAMQTSSIPRSGEVHADWRVMLFALGTALVAAVALGLVTAWHGTRSDIRDTLSSSQRTQASSGSSGRIRRSLVVLQMALTVVLLVGASLLGRSFVRLLELNPGFRTQHLVILDAALPFESGASAGVRRAAFYEELMARVRTIPGITRVGGASGVPLVGGGSDGTFLVMSRPDEPLRMEDFSRLAKDPQRSGYANYMVVDGNYFAAMNIPIITGRSFTSSDTPEAAHAAVISASLAKSKWPNESPIGKIIQYGNMDGDMRPFTIVGVVGDVRDQNLAVEPTPTFYAFQPQRTSAAQTFHVVMQTSIEPASVIASARAIARQLRPDIPAVLRTMETVVAESVADRRFALVLVGVFGGAALLLATLGVYSVVSYLVTQRRQEIGVRIALGAQRGDVLGLVLRQGANLAFLGIAIGGLGALFLTRLLKGLVFGVSTTDPLAFGGVMVLLTSVALLASWLPARRATRVDPMNVLRGL